MSQPNGFRVWVGVASALVLALSGWVYSAGSLSTQVFQNIKDIEENSEVISSTPELFVPRNEISVKFRNLELQIEAVQISVDANAEQSERQTAEIIRRIERIDTPRRNQ